MAAIFNELIKWRITVIKYKMEDGGVQFSS